jgi:hypothetical protein
MNMKRPEHILYNLIVMHGLEFSCNFLCVSECVK